MKRPFGPASPRSFSRQRVCGRLALAAVLCSVAAASPAPAATDDPACGALTLEPPGFAWRLDALAALPVPVERRDETGRLLPAWNQDGDDREVSDSFLRHGLAPVPSGEAPADRQPTDAVRAPAASRQPAAEPEAASMDFSVPVVAPASSVHGASLDLRLSGDAAPASALPGEDASAALAVSLGSPGLGTSWADNPPPTAGTDNKPSRLGAAATFSDHADAATQSSLAIPETAAPAAIGPQPALVSSGSYTKIVDSNTTAPGQSANFNSFYSPTIGGTNIAFYANTGAYVPGIYMGTAGSSGAVRIADINSTVPGQGVHFSDFGTAYPSPTSGGNVVFLGKYNNNNSNGIYTGTISAPGVVTSIADFSTPVPGQTGTFSYFSYPAISGGNVAFYALNPAGRGGIYMGTAGSSGSIVRIADTSMTAPGQSTTFSFSTNNIPPVISGGNVGFLAQFDNGSGGTGQGVYVGVAGSGGTSTVTRIADTSVTAPGQSYTFSNFYGPALSGSNVAFLGGYNNVAGYGIYTSTVGGTGTSTLARIVDYSTTAPGQSVTFKGFGTALAVSGSKVAFSGSYGNGSTGYGIYLGTVGNFGATRVVDTSITVPGQSTVFSSLGTFALSGGNVAFLGSYSGGSGIFLYQGGSLLDVAETGEALFGGTISGLGFTSSGLDGNTITFSYTLTNNVAGIATVSVVPEPATWLAGALTLAAAALTLRRRVTRR